MPTNAHTVTNETYLFKLYGDFSEFSHPTVIHTFTLYSVFLKTRIQCCVKTTLGEQERFFKKYRHNKRFQM